MPKERILYIDRLRGVNILLVVMGHVITNNVIDSSSNSLLVWGSTFRMPLFMFLCGYVAFKIITPKIFENYLNFIGKKARTLLLPFLAWPFLVEPFFFSDITAVDFKTILVDIISGGGLWFLWYLFWITLIYSFWLYITSKATLVPRSYGDMLMFIGVVTILLGIWTYFKNPAFKQFIFYLCFYFFGVFTAKYKYVSSLLLKPSSFTVGILVFVLLVDRYQYGASFPLNTAIRLVCAFSGIAIFYFAIRKLKFSEKVDEYIRGWGVKSLAIYVTHSYTVSIIGYPFISNSFNTFYMFLISGGITIIATLFCVAIFKLLSQSKILGLLLYGNKL
ncbi:acyltransferase family protein [Croceivirga sp. JEA036]|uniref:acyltransferase family protein n=1 Tax=Croceivirga sp. JEA036 TaxID=2721162 RepID=UPI0014394AE0|nr:acyltransferase [Croceivirga sp. JEA036]NJB35384.1 acyltransferase [Croceivirga sp. JEA036]